MHIYIYILIMLVLNLTELFMGWPYLDNLQSAHPKINQTNLTF